MKCIPLLLVAILLFLTACVDGGGHRSYIISDMGDNAAAEQAEKKK